MESIEDNNVRMKDRKHGYDGYQKLFKETKPLTNLIYVYIVSKLKISSNRPKLAQPQKATTLSQTANCFLFKLSVDIHLCFLIACRRPKLNDDGLHYYKVIYSL